MRCIQVGNVILKMTNTVGDIRVERVETKVKGVERHVLLQPYIQYFGRLEASQNNIVHFDMKKSISVDGILVEYVGSSCSENVISIKIRVPLIHYSEM